RKRFVLREFLLSFPVTYCIIKRCVVLFNISFYTLRSVPRKSPQGKLAEAINKKWGNFENFQKEFEQAGTTLFGSGWVWLSKDKDGNLVISKENNAGTPLTKGLTPLLTFDVWEHAYYIDYRNRRAEQLHNLWKIVDWSVVESRYL
uniref:superoxide dismutase n=1 Tax=Barnesiella intestinihominis TaxID=487174 RepID=UPI003A94FDE6